MESARAALRERAPGSEVYLVAAVRAAADDLARSVCAEAATGIRRFTLEGLAAELSSHTLATPISAIVREALAARVTSKALQEGKLQYFTPVAQTRGFAPALARTLLDLRMHAADPVRLAASGLWGQDLAVLLEAYEGELRAEGMADRASRFRIAIEVANSRELPDVMLVGVQPRFRLEQDFIAALQPLVIEAFLPAPHSALSSLQRYLFTDDKAPEREADSSFTFFSASGEGLECVEIARRILNGAAAGVPFDRMAVLLRRPERYGPLVSEALGRASIPAYYSQAAARPDPNGRALLALLHCAADGLSSSRFAEYLSLGQLPETAPEHFRWERLLTKASVMGGSVERWEARLGTLQGDVEAVDNLRAYALPLITKLSSIPIKGTWGEWLTYLRDLSASSLRDPGSVEELLDELQPMWDIGPVDFRGVMSVLEERLRFLRRAPEEERYGRVFVGSIDDSRGMTFHSVFLPGVNEGVFPARVKEDPLFLDERREAAGVPAAPDDTELLKAAVASATDHLCIGYSRIDLVTGRSRVPSFYVFDAFSAAHGRSPDVQELQSAARDAVDTRIDWPAPASADKAIDDLEFDLALLKPAFALGTPGAAAYLGSLNRFAIESLRSRYKRWNNKWTDSDGFVQLDEGVMSVLRQYRPTVYSWSVSRLEQFAVCPYQFALRGILQLHPLAGAEPPQRMDPIVKGLLFHRTIAELANGESTPERLNEALDRFAAEERDRLSPSILPVWEAEVESLRTDLQGWLSTRASGDWHSLHAEWEFDTTVLGKYQLHGKADIVEQNSAGHLRVVDLKTGSPPKRPTRSIGGGEVLQPALYAAAVEAVLGKAPTATRLEYATLRQNYKSVEVNIRQAQKDASQVLQVIDSAIDTGFLPAAPREEACESCDYRPICGPYEEERVRRKPKEEMRPLQKIRSTW